MSLAQIQPEEIRIMTISGSTIRLVLRSKGKVELRFEDEEQLRSDLESWADESCRPNPSSFLPFELRILPKESSAAR